MEEENIGFSTFCDCIGFKFVINLSETAFGILNTLNMGGLLLNSLKFFLFNLFTMSDLQKYFLQSCDTYTIGPDAKIVQIFIE